MNNPETRALVTKSIVTAEDCVNMVLNPLSTCISQFWIKPSENNLTVCGNTWEHILYLIKTKPPQPCVQLSCFETSALHLEEGGKKTTLIKILLQTVTWDFQSVWPLMETNLSVLCGAQLQVKQNCCKNKAQWRKWVFKAKLKILKIM